MEGLKLGQGVNFFWKSESGSVYNWKSYGKVRVKGRPILFEKRKLKGILLFWKSERVSSYFVEK